MGIDKRNVFGEGGRHELGKTQTSADFDKKSYIKAVKEYEQKKLKRHWPATLLGVIAAGCVIAALTVTSGAVIWGGIAVASIIAGSFVDQVYDVKDTVSRWELTDLEPAPKRPKRGNYRIPSHEIQKTSFVSRADGKSWTEISSNELSNNEKAR